MDDLMERIFGDNGTYQPRFALAKAPTTNIPRPTQNCDHLINAIAHDRVLSFLAPHEILSLWRTCKGTWSSSLSPSARRFVMLRSVFGYLRISEEAAQIVQDVIQGGWRAFCPLLVGLCEHLAHVYGHLEPDPAHRVFLAEQACFYHVYNHVKMGKLAAYEFHEEFGPSAWCGGPKMPAPSLAQLKNVGNYAIDYNGDTVGPWLEDHRRWMQEHANDSDEINEDYRLRLTAGLHPVIWICYSIEAEPDEWALAIGTKREQFVANISSYDDPLSLDTEEGRQNLTHTFWDCFKETNDRYSLADYPGGMIRFILGFPCSVEQMNDEEWTMGIAIWCMRHGLEPLTDASIDWVKLILCVCGEDDDDESGNKQFYMDALTSPLYGPADVNKYKLDGEVRAKL